MAKSNQKFLLKEATKIAMGTWTSPNLIGTNATDPLSFFSETLDLGYVKQGTTNIMIPRSYAEFRSGTPSKIVRKDLIQKDLSIEGELGQFDSELIALLKNTLEQRNYAITVPVFGVVDMNFLGSDEPTQSETGFLMTTALTDGKPFYIGVFAGKILTEDNNIGLSGTDYATQKFTITAFDETAMGDDQKNYGIMWERKS